MVNDWPSLTTIYTSVFYDKSSQENTLISYLTYLILSDLLYLGKLIRICLHFLWLGFRAQMQKPECHSPAIE